MTTLKGMTWNHPRGYDPMVATAKAWAEKTGVSIEWDKRSLQDFESFPVEDLARQYDMIVIDHPHVGQVVEEGCLAPLDVPGREAERQALAEGSVGASYPSYTYAGHQWAFPIDAATQVMTYDQSYRLTGMLDYQGAMTLRDVTYGYDTRDNLTSVSDALTASNSETFTYTPRESLATATGPYGALAYAYDGVGNRITYSVDGLTDTYTYPVTSNRLQTISLGGGGGRAFTYDAAGNTLTDSRGAGYSYTYDSAGRMASMSINGVLQGQYKYDFAGRQAIRTLTSTGQTIHSVFDASGNRIAEYDQNSGALLREYVWNGLTPVAVIEGGAV